jgi:hypothetical protein
MESLTTHCLRLFKLLHLASNETKDGSGTKNVQLLPDLARTGADCASPSGTALAGEEHGADKRCSVQTDYRELGGFENYVSDRLGLIGCYDFTVELFIGFS